MELPPPDYTLALRAGIAGSPSPRSEKRPQQGHDGGRRYEDHQKRNHAHRDPENQKGYRAKHDRGHDHRDRSDDPRTPPADDDRPSIALDHDHGDLRSCETSSSHRESLFQNISFERSFPAPMTTPGRLSRCSL